MKDYIIKHHYRINKYSDHILANYKSKGILNISNLLNISPMALVRFIFKTLYNKNLQELINSNILLEYDKQQYKIALENDIYGNLDNSETQLKSLEFEKQIENFY